MCVGSLLTGGCFGSPEEVADDATTPSSSTDGTTDSSLTSSNTDPAATTQQSTTGSGSTEEPTSDSTTDTCPVEVVEVPGRLSQSDVVLVVDTSPSMSDNAAEIQLALDFLAANAPLDTDDIRFTMMSAVGGDVEFCMDPPLGPAGCAGDSNPPHYARVNAPTGGAQNDPLGLLLEELMNGIPSLREGAQKHLLFITDQDTTLQATAVLPALGALGIDFLHARVHAAIGGDETTGCEEAPTLSNIVAARGGVEVTLCPLQPGLLFDAVTTPLASCVLDLPDRANDFTLQSVEVFADGFTAELELVESAVECLGLDSGGFIDEVDDELRLVLCPELCTAYQDAAGAQPGGVWYEVSECEE